MINVDTVKKWVLERQKQSIVVSLSAIGVISVGGLLLLAYTVPSSVAADAGAGIADIENFGVNKSSTRNVSDYDLRKLPFMEVDYKNSESGVAMPSALGNGKFTVEPVKSLHFREGTTDWYAYVFPAGQGRRAADDAMKEDTKSGYWDGSSSTIGKYVYGDVVLFASHGEGVDPDMAGMAKKLAPSCQVSTDNDYRGEDWMRNRIFSGDKFRELQIPMIVGPTDKAIKDYGMVKMPQETSAYIMPQKTVEELNKKLAKPFDAPKYPTSKPTPPDHPQMVKTVGAYHLDSNGPGCGWAYTGSGPSEVENKSVEQMNADNDSTYKKTSLELTNNVETYLALYKKYYDEMLKWEKSKSQYVEFQNKVLDQYGKENADKVVAGRPEILDGSIYGQIDSWRDRREEEARKAEEARAAAAEAAREAEERAARERLRQSRELTPQSNRLYYQR